MKITECCGLPFVTTAIEFRGQSGYYDYNRHPRRQGSKHYVSA
ncbi:hypothetical protein [Paenibacillus alvei]|nr:hypothetical protein [Paenibacillus alvei]